MPQTMDDVVIAAWDEYRRFARSPYLAPNSMPILYFGDSERYNASPCRIVTVGLNPSSSEFPLHAPASRFAGIDVLPTTLDALTIPRYRAALDAYFRTDPYRRWFDHLQPVLEGMNASFYDDERPNRVLHTDICSPLATDPTWSGLPRDVQYDLRLHGVPIWHSLIKVLLPHVIITSVARRHLDAIKFDVPPGGSDWFTVETITTSGSGTARRPYTVKARDAAITTEHKALIVFAPAAQMPFGTISWEQRRSVGRKIRDRK